MNEVVYIGREKPMFALSNRSSPNGSSLPMVTFKRPYLPNIQVIDRQVSLTVLEKSRMLLTFKSRASSDVTYFKAVATEILALLGKDPEANQGVFTVEQLGPAIVTLKRVIETGKTAPVLNEKTEDAEAEQIQVHLYQRAIPLLTLFERSKTANKPVTWGV